MLASAEPAPEGRTPEFPIRAAATRGQTQRLLRCLRARRPVLEEIADAGHNVHDRRLKQVMYR